MQAALKSGLVPLVWDAKDSEEALAAYVGLFLREEVQAEGLVRNLGAFTRFLEAVSFSHGSILNLSSVARDCEVKRSTAEGYLSILEDLLLSFRVPAFTRKAKRHITSKEKLFLFDTGVFRSLRPTGPLDRPEEIEYAALEGLVAQHLRTWCAYAPGNHELYYWRTKSGLEVDFVVYGESGIHAFEVKRTKTPRSKDLRGLKAFLEDYPQAKVQLLYLGNESIKRGPVQCRSCEDFLRSLHPDTEL